MYVLGLFFVAWKRVEIYGDGNGAYAVYGMGNALDCFGNKDRRAKREII